MMRVLILCVLLTCAASWGIRSTPVTYKAIAVKLATSAALVTSAAVALAQEPSGPVVVIGSGGKTGKLTVQALSQAGTKVRPTYRTVPNLQRGENILPAAVADVTKPDTLDAALAGASAVVFAASASKKGGNAEAVDYLGVANVAAACVRLKTPRLVVISSGAITRPNSLGFKLTNLFGNIMNFKLAGEDALRATYENASAGCTYAIIRPGGLLDGAAVGPANIELNQGDTIAGEVNRADVAACVAALVTSKRLPPAVTFEINKKGSVGPLEKKFPQPSGYERVGATYDDQFEGLKSNFNKA